MSDELGHNTGTVFAIMKKLLAEMKIASPGLRHVHYYTESPAFHNRNKMIFMYLAPYELIITYSITQNAATHTGLLQPFGANI